MKVAIVYDRVNKWGGAERVLLTLHEIFPDAPLFTSVYNPEKASWAQVFPEVNASFLQKIPFMNDKHELLAPLMPFAFETLDFSSYDLVISVTSEAAKGIITRPPTVHICYCLTPTRYLWSHYSEYFKGQSLKDLTKPVVKYLRIWDEIAAQRPDVMVGISTEVQDRIKKYYERESEIIYPPVDIDKFKNQKLGPTASSKIKKTYQNLKRDDYYLLVSRLVPYKKVDLAIKAFNGLGLPLVIVGTGSEDKKLKKMAKRNVMFKGLVSEKELVGTYQGAKALIFPQEEDFGITAVEAQACGIPVIAFKAGGALDTVIDGKTGIFFEKQTIEHMLGAIRRFHDSNHGNKMSAECIRNAQKFSKERFKKEFKELVEKHLSSDLQ